MQKSHIGCIKIKVPESPLYCRNPSLGGRLSAKTDARFGHFCLRNNAKKNSPGPSWAIWGGFWRISTKCDKHSDAKNVKNGLNRVQDWDYGLILGEVRATGHISISRPPLGQKRTRKLKNVQNNSKVCPNWTRSGHWCKLVCLGVHLFAGQLGC